MHKNLTRFFALSVVAALAVFAGKTYAEPHQALFAEVPVAVQAAQTQVVSHGVSVPRSHEDDAAVIPAAPAAPAAQETQAAQSVVLPVADATTASVDPAETSNGARQHFSIARGAGDDEDDGGGEDGSEDGE